MMLQWSEKFETGHSLIDSQHKMLITYVNQLEGMSRNTNPSRQDVEFCVQLISFLDTYIIVHFAHEERCMLSYKCPIHLENKQAHHDFLNFFRHFKLRFNTDGCRPDLLSEFHKTCSSWIQEHILQIDLQLKPCLAQAAADGRKM